MNLQEIANRIAEKHYPNKPNAIIDEPYREVRMKALKQQVEEELKNCFIHGVSNLLCGSFDADLTTSSTTKCKCGREKWEHPKAT